MTWLSVSLDGGGDGGARLAAVAGEHGAEGADHVGGGEQAAVLGGEQQEIAGQPLDLQLLEDGGERAALLLGARTTGLLTSRVRSSKASSASPKRLRSASTCSSAFCLEGKLEQRGGIAAGYAGTGVDLACHPKTPFLPNGRFFEPPRPRTRKCWDWRFRVNRSKPCRTVPPEARGACNIWGKGVQPRGAAKTPEE